jgi:hypothetical protein
MLETTIQSHAIGVYLAYPTAPVLKPIYRKLKTQVNDEHTKVGVTRVSFAVREREYKNTFQQEVKFVRLVEVPAHRLAEVEAAILYELGARYQRVGKAREWFHSKEHTEIAATVLAVVCRVLQDDA